jgi:hypothetical protein
MTFVQLLTSTASCQQLRQLKEDARNGNTA